MNVKNDFSFPPPGQRDAIRAFYAAINGNDSFDPENRAGIGWGVWSAEVHCSRGPILEKAGLAMGGNARLNG